MVTFGIDNGPIIMGIENERSELFWRLNLLCPELVTAGVLDNTDGRGPCGKQLKLATRGLR